MTEIRTDTEAVERLAWRVHESKAGHAVRVEACATLRALAAERDALRARAEAAEAERDRLRDAATCVLESADAAQMRPKPGCGVSGMTIEANIRGSAYYGVDAWPIEDLRAALSAPQPAPTPPAPRADHRTP